MSAFFVEAFYVSKGLKNNVLNLAALMLSGR